MDFKPPALKLADKGDGTLDYIELLKQFRKVNRLAKRKLIAERQRIVRRYIRAREANPYIDSLSPSMIMERYNRPTPSTTGVTAGIAASFIPNTHSDARSVTDHAIWGLILGATTKFCQGIGEVINAPECQRMAAFLRLVKDVGVAASISGAVAFAAKHLQQYLTENAPQILSTFRDPKLLASLASKILGTVSGTYAVAGTVVSGAFFAFQGLWHAIKAAIAKFMGDSETCDIEWEKAKNAVGIDNCVRALVSALSGAVAVESGFLGALVPCAIYFLSKWMMEYVISQKNRRGGCRSWFTSLIVQYRGPMVWHGGSFESFQSQITNELRCAISHDIVVDPVRSIRTGTLYERTELYHWIDEEGIDPLTREPATRLDYIDSPLAKNRAAKIASLLKATAVPKV
ncbi:hypothetical protein F5884DRAFT_886958 [Xylogone sp. PMI_703]|nr:hypothetical protein F5884DRAFT_886958 [Xylogone sp. PMI_703]